MKRRSVVRAVGGGTLGGLAGCFSREDEAEDADDEADPEPDPEDPDLGGTIRIATTDELVLGDRAAGEWLREAFEEAFPDAELEWTVPEAGIDHYIQRARQDAAIDADVYFGLTAADLVRIDDRLEDGALFRELDVDRLGAADRVRGTLDPGDPFGRLIPSGVRYGCLLYDETEIEAPDALDELLEPAYERALLAQHPERSELGLGFLLWTIGTVGSDGYLEYWQDLEDNGVRIVDDWTASVTAYADGERPVTVGYATDRLFAHRTGLDMNRFQIAFPNDQGYELPVGMAVFERAEAIDLAYDFLEFVLSSEVQAELADRHYQFPAISDVYVEHSGTFETYAREPPTAVTMGYDRLRSGLDGWLSDWTATIDGR